MKMEERTDTSSAMERPTCSAVVLDNHNNSADADCQQRSHQDVMIHSHHHRHTRSSAVRNIEIDWREVDPYFPELSDCASFWTLINFTYDLIYSGLFVLFFIMGQDVESMFFEGLLNHINPILIYLILSLIINYGALRCLRSGREKCFLVFSVTKALLFPITISLLLYLVLCDVQDYFGTFWVSFVVIVSCYNLTAALGLWSMFTCNKYILVNEAAQKRIRQQAKLKLLANNEGDCRCGCPSLNAGTTAVQPTNNCNYSQCASTSRTCSFNLRKVGDSSSNCTNNIILVCKPDSSININSATTANKSVNKKLDCKNKNTSKSNGICNERKVIHDLEDDDTLSYGEDDEVLQISTVHKVMQEIRILDSKNKPTTTHAVELSVERDNL